MMCIYLMDQAVFSVIQIAKENAESPCSGWKSELKRTVDLLMLNQCLQLVFGILE